jgi:hypothetical protein
MDKRSTPRGNKLISPNQAARRRAAFDRLESRRLLASSAFLVNISSSTYCATTQVASAPGGAVVEVGLFSGQANFNPHGTPYMMTASGDTDVFIAKYDANGVLEWADRFGGPQGSFPQSTAVDIDTDPSRAGNWVNSLDTEPEDLGEYVNGVAVDKSGNIYFTGAYRGAATFGGATTTPLTQPVLLTTDIQYYDIYLIKLNPNGTAAWADSMGGRFQDVARGIALDSAGDPYICGQFARTASFAPNNANPPAADILSTPGRNGAFVAKYSTTGALVWAKATAISDETDAERRAYANAIVVDSSGDAFVTGVFAGDADFDPSGAPDMLNSMGKTDQYIQKFSSTGAPGWVQDIGGSNQYSGGTAIAISPGGTRVYAGGYFQDTVQIGQQAGAPTFTTVSNGGDPDYTDLLITKLNASTGSLVWARQYGNNSWKTLGQMTTDAQGNLFITGGFYYTVNFAPGRHGFTLTSVPNSDNFNDNNDGSRSSAYNIYVVKLSEAGTTLYADQIGGVSDCFGVGLDIEDDGDLLVSGRFRGTVNFDPTGQTLRRLKGTGASAGFTVRLTPTGALA